MTALASGAELPEKVIIDKVEQLHIDNQHDNHHVAVQFCENQHMGEISQGVQSMNLVSYFLYF